jgi:hypothetical protein
MQKTPANKKFFIGYPPDLNIVYFVQKARSARSLRKVTVFKKTMDYG